MSLRRHENRTAGDRANCLGEFRCLVGSLLTTAQEIAMVSPGAAP